MTNEQAIKILVGNRNFYERIVRPYDREMVEALNMAIKALEERPTGEWIETEEECKYDDIPCSECSICKHTWVLGEMSIDDVKSDFLYCPNCGAKMMKECRE